MERTTIHEAVERARAGDHKYLICKLETCWVVAADLPLLRGHCVTLADPVVFGVNDLSEELRMKYFRDICRVGDALLKVCGSYRINYETLCNVAQALHSHIIPRYLSEPEIKRKERAAIGYPINELKPFNINNEQDFINKMKTELCDRNSND